MPCRYRVQVRCSSLHARCKFSAGISWPHAGLVHLIKVPFTCDKVRCKHGAGPVQVRCKHDVVLVQVRCRYWCSCMRCRYGADIQLRCWAVQVSCRYGAGRVLIHCRHGAVTVWYYAGTLQARCKYCAITVQILRSYDAGARANTMQVRCRYAADTVQILCRYDAGIVQV